MNTQNNIESILRFPTIPGHGARYEICLTLPVVGEIGESSISHPSKYQLQRASLLEVGVCAHFHFPELGLSLI